MNSKKRSTAGTSYANRTTQNVAITRTPKVFRNVEEPASGSHGATKRHPSPAPSKIPIPISKGTYRPRTLSPEASPPPSPPRPLSPLYLLNREYPVVTTRRSSPSPRTSSPPRYVFGETKTIRPTRLSHIDPNMPPEWRTLIAAGRKRSKLPKLSVRKVIAELHEQRRFRKARKGLGLPYEPIMLLASMERYPQIRAKNQSYGPHAADTEKEHIGFTINPKKHFRPLCPSPAGLPMVKHDTVFYGARKPWYSDNYYIDPKYRLNQPQPLPALWNGDTTRDPRRAQHAVKDILFPLPPWAIRRH